MNLAIILGIYLLSLGSPSQPPGSSHSARPSQDSAPASQAQAPQSQSTEPANPSPSQTGQTPATPAQAPPSPTHHRHRKKVPNCSNSPVALNPAVDTAADASNQPSGLNKDGASKDESTKNAATDQSSAKAASPSAASTALPPCPPPKKVIRNGGSNEPTIELKGGSDQPWQSRSTEELTAATQENLNKIAGRQLNPSQQEVVSQIKQFMEQSKKAVAAGDVQSGHNLAAKAHLLSDELVKP